MNRFLPQVAFYLFGSGLCALIYQVAWLRLLRQIFGGSTAASASVVAIFMAGLGMGGFLLGRRSERQASPLGFYAHLEIGVALAAAASIPLVAAVRWLYFGLGGAAALGELGSTLVRLALAAVVLGVSTFLMGGTLPAAVRAVTAKTDHSRHTVGLLYATNTLGAVTGALLTTFVLLELLGIRQTILLAAALNLLIAVAARATARRLEAPRPATLEEVAAVATRPGRVRLVLAAAAVVGFVFFLLELVWYRMMAPILGGSTYTFGIVLAVALAGIGLGGLAYAARGRARRPSPLEFAVTCALEALVVAVPLALGDRLAFFAHELRGLEAAGFPALALGWTLVTAVVVLPAAAIAGYQFPLLVGLLGDGRERVGAEVGLAYAWNTIGAIAGSVAGGFGLLPLLGAPGCWRLSVIALALLALVFLVHALRAGSGRPVAALAAVPALAAVLVAAAPGPTAFWRHSGIGAGRMRAVMRTPNEIRDIRHSLRRSVVWEADGRESSVAAMVNFDYSFFVNGKSDGSARADAPTQVMSGLVGAVLHPEPRTGLVIGLGTGSSAGWLADVATMERVDGVELEPAILRVARDCAAVNRDVLNHPRVEIVLGDAREFLLTTDRTYDVVFSEPSNPYRAGVASLFTTEFYAAARARLNPGGVFVQWLQAYEVDAQVIRTAYATMLAVFPSVETWQVHRKDLLLVASVEPIEHDVERLRRRVAQEPYASAMAHTWGVGGVEGFYSAYLASPDFARAVASLPLADLNTDDRPRIEFGFARQVGRSSGFQVEDLAQLAQFRGEHRPAARSEIDWARVDELRRSRYVAFGAPPPPFGLEQTDLEAAARNRARTAYSNGDLEAAYRMWSEQSAEPWAEIDRLLVAEAAAEAGDPRAESLTAGLAAADAVETAAIRARLALRRGLPAEARRRLVEAFEGYRTDPWPPIALMQRALALVQEVAAAEPAAAGELFAALAEPFAVGLLDQNRLMVRLLLADHLGTSSACVEAHEGFEPHVPWSETFLVRRLDCYRRSAHPDWRRAERELGEFRAASEIPLWRGLEPDDYVDGPGLEEPPVAAGGLAPDS